MEKLDNSWDLHLGDDIGIWHSRMAWSLVHGLFGMFLYLLELLFLDFLVLLVRGGHFHVLHEYSE